MLALSLPLLGCPSSNPPAPDSDGDGILDRADRCPQTPIGIDVDIDGCALDSDGDGVSDSKDRCPDTQVGALTDANGCIVMQQVLLPTVNFEVGSSILPPDAQMILDEASTTLRANPDLQIMVAGHTNDGDSRTRDMILSKRRALAAFEYLVTHGVDRCQMQAVGYGALQPIALNDPVNNRVDLRIRGGNSFDELPKFSPWPPPQPSSSVALSTQYFADDGNLKDAASRLTQALSKAGYVQRLYSAPDCGNCGFALVTRLERINEDGSPVDGLDRFRPVGEEQPGTFISYLKSLFKAPTGYYRMIIFVVTDDVYVPDSEPIASAAEAERILQSGTIPKLAPYSNCGFVGKSIDALIYEFRMEPGQDTPEVIEKGLIPPYVHFEKSGLSDLLAPGSAKDPLP